MYSKIKTSVSNIFVVFITNKTITDAFVFACNIVMEIIPMTMKNKGITGMKTKS